MPPPTNLSFETAGVGAGEAASWAFSSSAAYEDVAFFTDDSIDGFETGWGNTGYLFVFTNLDILSAQFGTPPELVEDFEEGWADPYFKEMPATGLAVFTGLLIVEGFESGWSNVPYLTAVIDGVDILAGLFDAGVQPREDFENGWGNTPYLTSFVDGFDTLPGLFDGNSNQAESFLTPKAPLLFAVDPATDVFSTSLAHGFVNGDTVQMTEIAEYPAPLVEGVDYFIVGATLTTFQLSFTSGGPAIDITSPAGTGAKVRPDPTLVWLDVLT